MCRARDGHVCQQTKFFAQLHRREFAAAGARVRRRHRSGDHRQKRHRPDQNRVQGAGAERQLAKFTFRILTATTRRPSRMTTRLSPRRRGCRAGSRFITRPISPAIRTFFTTILRPASAAVIAGIFRLEHERGGFAGRLEGGDDFEPERQPERLGMQRGRHEFETVDISHGGRIVAVLVAGRAMDLFRDQNARAPRAGESSGGRRRRCSAFRRRALPNPTEPDWSPDGKWIAFTSQMGEFNICVVPADGGMPPRCWCRANIRRGRRTRARWFSNRDARYRQIVVCA